ncbi:acyltransferase family protein [Aliarcobacter butzleri]|uniref:acyltransferase family protein n=1 Tax=Aliarcobacter butzleri TaxID=28197 RepID=UPI0024DE7168|nr:acyltransferase family protein [Aliarcobacter butzleri]MDK2084129.1 acyltransferase family protein [Aliarcobacter butzleri]
MKHRFLTVDLLRILAVVLVVYAHFVSVGGGATSLPDVVNSTTSLPIYNSQDWSMWKFEIFLINVFSTQTGILGVSLFFIVTGYLMPFMMDRYTRKEFLINRLFRIVPVLIISMLIIGLFVYVTQGISYSLKSYIGSFTLSYLVIGVVPIVGVLWTLVVEVIFYFITSVIGKFNFEKIILFQIIGLSIIILSTKYQDIYYLKLLATNIRYILMIFIGSAIYIAQKNENLLFSFIYVLSSVIIAYIGFYLYKLNFNDISTYNNIGTFILATSLMLLAVWGGGIYSSFTKVYNTFFRACISNLSYTCSYRFRHDGGN